MFSKSNLYKVLLPTATVGLVLSGFFIAQMSVVFCLQAAFYGHFISENSLQSATLQFSASVVAYVLALAIIISVAQMLGGPIKDLRGLLGLSKKPTFITIYYAVVGYGVYFLLSFFFMAMVHWLITDFDINQQQPVGFDQLSNQFEYILAFITLVILAPVAEEMIFRGFLFGKLRQRINFWWTAVVVSVVFGFVHLQWNVGIDVFALSLVLCFLREKTGSIWAGIGVHMIKNVLAFTILFLQFDIQKLILQLL